MRVEITTPPGIFADGMLKGTLAEHGVPSPHLVIEMNVAGVPHPVKVTLDTADLATIVRLAKSSTVLGIRAAVL